MENEIPKPVREFFKDVERAASKQKKSVIISTKKARSIIEALNKNFGSQSLSANKWNKVFDF